MPGADRADQSDQPKPYLSDHDLRQLDDVWLERQSVPVLRGLVSRMLADLRLVRSQLGERSEVAEEGRLPALCDSGALEGAPDLEGPGDGARTQPGPGSAGPRD